MKTPTVSVIVPNYNHGDYIGHALEAILDQSRKPDEILVLDDASTDNSVEVIESIANRSDLVTLYQNEQNRGVVAACNRLFGLAKSDYVMGTPADDIVLPGSLERSLGFLEQHPGAGVCCSDYSMVDINSGDVSLFRMRWSEAPEFFLPESFAEVLKGWWVPSMTSLIRRDALLTAGAFIPELKWHSDWFAYLVVAFRHGLCYVPQEFIGRRRHDDSYAVRGRRNWSEQREVLKHLLGVLKSEAYRDVMPWFVRSGAMVFFNNELDRLVMTEPELWDTETLMLAQLPIWYRHNSCRKHIEAIWDEREKSSREDEIRAFLGMDAPTK